jgi:hypothetical protein
MVRLNERDRVGELNSENELL